MPHFLLVSHRYILGSDVAIRSGKARLQAIYHRQPKSLASWSFWYREIETEQLSDTHLPLPKRVSPWRCKRHKLARLGFSLRRGLGTYCYDYYYSNLHPQMYVMLHGIQRTRLRELPKIPFPSSNSSSTLFEEKKIFSSFPP